jgi:hypothetical protein
MGLKKLLFGGGKLKFEGETTDGQTFTGSMPFEGVFHEKDAINQIVAHLSSRKKFPSSGCESPI